MVAVFAGGEHAGVIDGVAKFFHAAVRFLERQVLGGRPLLEPFGEPFEPTQVVALRPLLVLTPIRETLLHLRGCEAEALLERRVVDAGVRARGDRGRLHAPVLLEFGPAVARNHQILCRGGGLHVQDQRLERRERGHRGLPVLGERAEPRGRLSEAALQREHLVGVAVDRRQRVPFRACELKLLGNTLAARNCLEPLDERAPHPERLLACLLELRLFHRPLLARGDRRACCRERRTETLREVFVHRVTQSAPLRFGAFQLC